MTGEQAALIGLDWGTTSFRAYRIDAVGRVLEQRSRDAGILKVQQGDFAGTLSDAIGDWLTAAPGLPVLAAGMIGSRQGWLEAPYALCPAGLSELAAGLVTVEAQGHRSVPDRSWRDPAGWVGRLSGCHARRGDPDPRRFRGQRIELRHGATYCRGLTASGPNARTGGLCTSPPT